MDSIRDSISSYRPIGVRSVPERWRRGNRWVRPKLHYAIRRTTFFFLRPWDGVEVPRLQWERRSKPGETERSGGRESTESQSRKQRLILWLKGFAEHLRQGWLSGLGSWKPSFPQLSKFITGEQDGETVVLRPLDLEPETIEWTGVDSRSPAMPEQECCGDAIEACVCKK